MAHSRTQDIPTIREVMSARQRSESGVGGGQRSPAKQGAAMTAAAAAIAAMLRHNGVETLKRTNPDRNVQFYVKP